MHRSSWLATTGTLVSSQAEKDAVTSKMQREWSAYSPGIAVECGTRGRRRNARCCLQLAIAWRRLEAAVGQAFPTAAFGFEDLLGCCFFLHGHMSKTKGPLINVCRLFSQQLKPNFSNVVESARVCQPCRVSADGDGLSTHYRTLRTGATYINKHFYYRKSLHFTISIELRRPPRALIITLGQKTQATTFHLSPQCRVQTAPPHPLTNQPSPGSLPAG
jgi:hypothetical protein